MTRAASAAAAAAEAAPKQQPKQARLPGLPRAAQGPPVGTGAAMAKPGAARQARRPLQPVQEQGTNMRKRAAAAMQAAPALVYPCWYSAIATHVDQGH